MTIVWFRHDLRLDDNPALVAAVQRGEPIVPLYVWSPEDEGSWPPGAASRWWLHHSLESLDASLRKLGSKLVVRSGKALEQVAAVAKETNAKAIFWNRRYEPAIIARDSAVKATLRGSGLVAESFNGSLIFEPWEAKTKQGTPFQVFTAFWKDRFRLGSVAAPVDAPTKLESPQKWPKSLVVSDLKLLPTIAWDVGFRKAWHPGETSAKSELSQFLVEAVDHYDHRRDLPARRGTSRLSPFLHFGEISPRRIWQAVMERVGELQAKSEPANKKSDRAEGEKPSGAGPDVFLKEIGWREFAYHLLYHFPTTPEQPLKSNFLRFPWGESPEHLRAWQKGQTGIPLVDAGMRELWTTGWMHNRVRMVVASFLVKNLLLPWQAGAQWFWDTLVDADLASNTLGWQWSAGCGADAAPYFRIFNPVLQSEKFDPQGEYLRRWVPEIASLPNRDIHQPWEATEKVLRSAGIELGVHYPRPIVDLSESRNRALAAFHSLRD